MLNISETTAPTTPPETIGFIISRYVNNELTNKYWQHCYDCIRKFYPEYPIVIIDDNSDYQYISTDKVLYKTEIVQSEFAKRGELLPYYYYVNNKYFDIAVIIHDSLFINSYIDLHTNDYKMLWTFSHNFNNVKEELEKLSVFNNKDIISFYNKRNAWQGCFGCMAIVNYNYLKDINNTYNLSLLLPVINNREDRCNFERVIGCLLCLKVKNPTIYGDIHNYCKWGITFADKDRPEYNKLPVIKVWTGR